jgi:PAS domain S-box-containing protein
VAATIVLTLCAGFFDRSRRRALSESDRRFRKMADATPVPVALRNAQLRCTYVNRACISLTGARPEALLGRGWLSAVHADDRAGV